MAFDSQRPITEKCALVREFDYGEPGTLNRIEKNTI